VLFAARGERAPDRRVLLGIQELLQQAFIGQVQLVDAVRSIVLDGVIADVARRD
jgi:hypothetical protein